MGAKRPIIRVKKTNTIIENNARGIHQGAVSGRSIGESSDMNGYAVNNVVSWIPPSH